MTVQPGSRIETKALLRAVPPPVRPRFIPRHYAPPRFPPDLVGLERRQRWLGALARHELCIVRAPAGYGKTAFCAALSAQAREEGWSAGWISFDRADKDAAAVDQLFEAVRLARGAIMADNMPACDTASPARLADALAEQIDAASQPLLLVLDDIDRIVDARAIDVLNQLLCHPPAQLRLVLASRALPPVEIGRPERRGMMLRIGAAELALTDEELGTFLAGAGVKLDPKHRAALNDFLRGWPAGARLAAQQPDGLAADDGWRDLTSRIDAQFGALIDDVSDTAQTFLHRIAVAPKLDVGLGRLLSGKADTDKLLANLAAQGLFIEASMDGGGWYNFHPAFRAALLRRTDQGEQAQLHRAAARYYAARGLMAEAVDQALAGGDIDHAGALIAEIAMPMLERGMSGRVAGWLGQLPRALIAETPALVHSDAWLAVLTGRVDAGNALAALTVRGTEAEAEAVKLFYRAYVGDRLDEVAEACDRILAAPDGLSDFAVAMVRAMRAHGALRRGLFGLVHDSVRPLMSRRFHGSLDLPLALGVCARAAVSRAQGRLGEAERVLRDTRRAGAEPSLAAALIDAALARYCYERDDPVEAAALAAAALPLLEQGVFQDALIHAFFVAIRVAANAGVVDEAAALIDRAEFIAFDRGWMPLKALCVVERARLRLPQTIDPEAVVALVDEEAAVIDPLSVPGRAFALLAEMRAYEAIANGDRPRLTLVAERLLQLASNADDSELRTAATLFNILPQLSGRCDKMVDLETVRFLNHAASVGFRRTIVDVLDVTGVRGVQNFCSEAYASDCFLALLKLAEASRRNPALEGTHASAPGEAFSFLTEREIEILSALNAGESNKEIARTLQLAPETVKWHLKNVMRKLRANTREEAVQNASTLGLKLIEITPRH
ncbi:LuxR C-terminal-related transcriptional regulator [Sphingopyxis sp.]|uniref:LuxR C-terminal-related transcriptional regulator n=1 Tax=Sphingopyxis sp. TaxID=1908224 RepID=UPI003D12F028